MLRLFTGLSLPPEIRQQLHVLQGGVPGARWTHMNDYHITLSFIGDVDEATAEDIDDILSRLRAPDFTLTLKGTGHFSRGERSGHLWIGVEPNAALHHLKEKVDQALLSRQLPVDKRKYTPHVTLARLRQGDEEKVAAFMQQHNLFTAGPFPVEDFILYHSHLANDGPSYEEMVSYPLSIQPSRKHP